MRSTAIIFVFLLSVAGTRAQHYEEMISRILAHPILPVAGYNVYDGVQVGAVLHNYAPAPQKLSYYLAPAYAFGSRSLTGYAGIQYAHKDIRTGIHIAGFSKASASDSAGQRIFEKVYKIAPAVRLGNFEWKTFLIGETEFDYVIHHADSMYVPVEGKLQWRYINQLSFQKEVIRELFPYKLRTELQQARDFYRINLEAFYFFNYWKRGGVQARIFVSKFGTIGASSYETIRYQPKLTAVNGHEDYTYSNFFFGRTEFEGLASQQMMLRDGGLKLRTDMFHGLQGRSDSWVAAINLNATIAGEKFPLRVFFDAGTYGAVWKEESSEPRFLYVAGLQLSLLRNLVNIYAPVFYSKQFRDQLSSVPEQKGFFRKISFSIDIHQFNLRRFL